MPRSSFGLATLFASLTVLSLSGTASAQWFSGFGGGRSCGCSAPPYMGTPPIMRQTASAYSAAPMTTASYAYSNIAQSGPPVCCYIEQPVQVVHVPVVQTVKVQPMQTVVHPVVQDVHVTEYHPVKQTVNRPVVKTEYVDQMVTEMRPVTEQRTANVSTVDYQNVTEYKTTQKQVGYWVTNNVPTGRVPSWQYDNRPNAAGFMNRASYDLRNAFTPMYRQQRTFVPQTMTCTQPYTKQVAVPGMKQVTYNVTTLQPTQTTRKVAQSRIVYEPTEVTVMKPITVVKTIQTGTRLSYAPIGGTAIGSAPSTEGAPATTLKPTPDQRASGQKAPRSAERDDTLDADQFKKNGTSYKPSNSVDTQLSESAAPARTTESTVQARKFSSPSVVRVNQWVARTPASSSPQPGGQSAAIAIADSTR